MATGFEASLLVFLVGLLVGGFAVHVGSVIALTSQDYGHALVTAVLGALAWAIVDVGLDELGASGWFASLAGLIVRRARGQRLVRLARGADRVGLGRPPALRSRMDAGGDHRTGRVARRAGRAGGALAGRDRPARRLRGARRLTAGVHRCLILRDRRAAHDHGL